MFTRTKIVCTIGPAVASFDQMVALIEAGMNVARLNFSHGTHEEHERNIKNLKKARKELKKPLALMLDLSGPKIRVDQVKNDALHLTRGQKIRLVEKGDGSPDAIPFHPKEVFGAMRPGMKVLFDDGYIIGIVLASSEKEATIEIQNSGILKSGKGIALPGAVLPLPAMTEKDFIDLEFGCRHDVDLIAASFIRSAHHIFSIRECLIKHGKPHLPIIAKIESTQGVENFDSIVQVADGIMIARGDLGVELDLATVPKLQKIMIRKCFQACKPSITATQMLESMITNPRPTRAEVSDVANAVYDGTSSIMLSAETAVGKYPIEAVQWMKSIANEAEADVNYPLFFAHNTERDYHDISSSVSLSAVKTAYSANAKAIFAFTASGATAQMVSRLRPEMPIIAVTPHEENYHRLGALWGVVPILCPKGASAKEAFALASQYALQAKIIAFGDVVVVTAGIPFGKKGTTNLMIVEHIGEVLVRGHKGFGPKVSGKISILFSSVEKNPEELKRRLVVIPYCDHTFLPLLKEAAGVILQNHIGDSASEKYAALVAKNFEIPVMGRADGAMSVLREGEMVTLDPQKGLIYRGKEEMMKDSSFSLDGFFSSEPESMQ